MATTTANRHRATSAKQALVDKALRKRYQDAMARYRQALDDESAGWDTRYEVLGEIIHATPPYYLAGGYSTVGSFLKAEVPGESKRSITTAIRVARSFDPEDESRFGISNLDALLSYLEAEAGGSLGRAKLHPGRQKIRVREGKSTKQVPFAQATREQVKAATRAAQGKASGSGAKLPPAVAALKRALAQAGLADVAVSMRGGKVALSGIATDCFVALARVLKSVKG
jgi:hypothetical protein